MLNQTLVASSIEVRGNARMVAKQKMNKQKRKIWNSVAPYWKRFGGWLHKLSLLGFTEQDVAEIEQEDEEELAIIEEAETAWQRSQPYFSKKEWFEIFPEARQVIPKKIEEVEVWQAELRTLMKKKLALIASQAKNETSKWFWEDWIKIVEGEAWLFAGEQIKRLKTMLAIGNGKQLKGGVSQEDIQQALAIPIETLLSRGQLKKSGKTLVGLCPLHKEKTPSFRVYPETNSFYCFGCQKGGNVITLAEQLHGYSFPEAVKLLINK